MKEPLDDTKNVDLKKGKKLITKYYLWSLNLTSINFSYDVLLQHFPIKLPPFLMKVLFEFIF